MDIRNILLILISFFDTILGFVILFRNWRKPAHFYFAFYSFCLAFWALTILLFNVSDGWIALFWMKTAYVAAVFITITLWSFSLTFPERKFLTLRENLLVFIPSILLIVFLYYPSFLTKSLTYHSWGKGVQLDFFDYLLFTIYFVIFYGGSCVRLFVKFLRSSGIYRVQFFYLILIIYSATVLGVTFNLILPSPMFEDHRYIWLGPISMTVIVVGVFYAITRYRFLSLKIVIRNKLASIVSILISVALSIFVTIYISSQFSLDQLSMKMVIILFSIFLFLLSRTCISFILNKVWPCEGVDLINLLSKIEENIKGENEIEKKLPIFSLEICKAFSLSRCGIFIRKIDGRQLLSFWPQKFYLTQKQYDTLWSWFGNESRIIIVDELLPQGHRMRHEKLKDWNISILLLIKHLDFYQGIIVLGPKKDNSSWSKEEIESLIRFRGQIQQSIGSVLLYDQAMEGLRTRTVGMKKAGVKVEGVDL